MPSYSPGDNYWHIQAQCYYDRAEAVRMVVPINDEVTFFYLDHPGHVNVSTMGHEADRSALCCHPHTAGPPNAMDVVSQSVRKVIENDLCHLQRQRTREFLAGWLVQLNPLLDWPC